MNILIQIFLISILISFGGCFEKTYELNCNNIDEILLRDQYYRKKHGNLLSPYFFILDSLLKNDGYKKGISDSSLYEGNLRDSLSEVTKGILKTRQKPNKNTLDSIWSLQKINDTKNSLEVINLINKFGLEKLDTFNNGCYMNSLIVFVHTPEKLKEDVRKVIEPELKKIDSFRYNHIIWHLNGRNKR